MSQIRETGFYRIVSRTIAAMSTVERSMIMAGRALVCYFL